MTKTVLLVCMGNICRSPMAEGVLRDRAFKRGVEIEIDSAGTGAWHVGDPPDGRAIVAARLRGVEISGLRSRQISGDDFERFDLLLAMDESNITQLEKRRPAGNNTPIMLFAGFIENTDQVEIADPYYSGKFEAALDVIENAAEAFLTQLLTARQ